MAKDSNIVHQYFRKEIEGAIIMVKVNPVHFIGTEITVYTDGTTNVRDLEFDENITGDLNADGFTSASALEFNLYYSGLV